MRETPVSRGDAYSLVEEFESAMAIMGKQKDGAEGRVEAFTSPMQNDMHALQVRKASHDCPTIDLKRSQQDRRPQRKTHVSHVSNRNRWWLTWRKREATVPTSSDVRHGPPSIAHEIPSTPVGVSYVVIPRQYTILRVKQHEVGRNFGARAAVVEAVQIMERGGEVRVDRRSLSRDGEVDSEQVGIYVELGRRSEVH